MQRDLFDDWNQQKKKTNLRKSRTPFRDGEIWWCSLGVNIGDEQNGKGKFFSRPVLVFRKFNANIFLALPLSTILKENRYYHRIHFKGIEQCVVLSQLRLMDAKRLENRLGSLPSHEFDAIRKSLKNLLF